MLVSFSKCSKKNENTPPSPPPEKPKPIKLALIDHTNGETPFSDSIYLTFSKKIKVNYIKSNYQYCITDDMGISYTSDSKGFKFKYSCAELGRTYPFEYSVTDEEGNTLTNKINIDFFTNRIQFDGFSVLNTILSPDNKHIWLTLTNIEDVNRFVSLSTDSLKVEFDIPVPDASKDISYNPYNGFIYISSFYHPQIFVFDPIAKKLVKTITLNILPEDNETYPAIFPADIRFTKNGFGIVNLNSEGSAGINWKIIDSTKEDTIYYGSEKDGTYASIGQACLINDSTQIMGYSGYLRKIVVIDQVSRDIIKTFESPIPVTYTPYFKVSTKNNNVMVYGNGVAFMNTKSNAVHNHHNEGFFPWDFSYRSNEPNHIFGMENQHVILFNYLNGNKILSYPLGITPTFTYMTSDGKSLACAGIEGVYLFSEKMFTGGSDR
ncbi:hypothetical protein SAMN05661044_04617 [Olivibacter domesticus]|uniref:SbsA Ig-like domain-containing protein n=2 Tax=Olivibacter domesticus TaxID=407022 RepID=A0A1H7WQR2_OLID1|nr:hypothetical protein SAMN05661044_04617 [Olivibacter domesticus]